MTSRALRAGYWRLAIPLLVSLALPATARASADVVGGADGHSLSAVQGAGRPLADVATGGAAADSLGLISEFEVDGLKVLVKRREGSQTVVAGLYLRGGAANVTAEDAGIEALMLAVATEASENFPRERLRRELSSIGTEIGSAAGYDYSALTMNSTRLHFDRSWEIFTDVAVHPSFNPEDFLRVKNGMVASLSNAQDTPDAYLQMLQSRVAFLGHPYMNDPRGTVEAVGRLQQEDVGRHHREVMQKTRLLLVLVGDLDPLEIRRRVEVSFGRLPRGSYRSEPLPQLSFAGPTLEVTPRNLITNYVQGIYAAPPLTSPDYHAMRVATSILQSRVYQEVRERRNLSYAPDAFLWNRGANLGGIYVTADDANRAVSIMLEEIGRLQRNPISEQALISTAQHFLTTYYLRQETSAAQADVLAQYELIGGGWRNSDAFLEGVRGVTPEDVLRVASTYMRNLQFVVLGDPRRIDRAVFTGAAAR